MAQEYYFFDSTKDDIRRYQARHLAEILDTVLQTGLLHKDGTPTIRVVANTKDMKVRVTAGKAVIKGHLYINTDDYEITLPKTDTVKRIVLRLDTNIDNRYIKLFVTEGDTNLPKPLVRENGVYELALCQIKFDASKGYIEQTDIIDTRFNENLCGLAHSLITVPTTEYQKEWNEFVQRYEKWFQQHQNSSYATLDYVKRNDDELRRLIAEIQLGGGGGGVVEGLSFATDFELYQNISLKEGIAKTTAINSRSVVIDKTISGLTAGDGVTLYDGSNQEQLTVSSVSGLTVNFTTTITKTFKAGADLARSMGIAESGKKQYSFGGYGSELTLHDRNEVIKVVASGLRVSPITQVETLLQDNIVYFVAKSRYGTYFMTYDLVTKRKLEEWKKTSMDITMGFANDNQVVVTSHKNSEANTAEIFVYKNGLLQRSQTFSRTFSRVDVVKGINEVSMFDINSNKAFIYKVDENGYLTQKYSGTHVTHYLGQNVYLSHFMTEYYSTVIEGVGDTTVNKGRVIFGSAGETHLINLLGIDFVCQKDTKNNNFYAIAVSDVIAYTATANSNTSISAIKEVAGFIAKKVFPTGNRDIPLMVITTNSELMFLNSFGEFKTPTELGDLSSIMLSDGFTFMRMRGDVPYKINGNKIYNLPHSVTSQGDDLTINLKVNGTIGEGSKLLSNDVRFKLPRKTTGISAVAYLGSGITIDAKLGNVTLNKSTSSGKTQISGLVSTPSDELTVTMKRLTTTNDNGIQKLSGGVDA